MYPADASYVFSVPPRTVDCCCVLLIEITCVERYCQFRCQRWNESPVKWNLVHDGIDIPCGLPVHHGHQGGGIYHPIFGHAVRGVDGQLGLEVVTETCLSDLDHQHRIATLQVIGFDCMRMHQDVRLYERVRTQVKLGLLS